MDPDSWVSKPGQLIDMHTHTVASDGALTAVELVEFAVERGLSVLAVTDHDTTGSIETAITAASGRIEIWPGVEISSDIPGTEVHVLGYFIDYHSPSLQRSFELFRDSRFGRAEDMVKRLGTLGMNISWDRVREIAGEGSVGRPHLAQAMLEAGYVQSVRDAFDNFIGRNGPAYVERFKLSPEEAVRLIRDSGGLAVLAHPLYIDPAKGASGTASPFDIRGYVGDLVGVGLEGIEVYYGDSTIQQTREMIRLADDLGLMATGGTDFHGGSVGGRLPGETPVPESVVVGVRNWLRSRSLHSLT